jgi:hypothetical protein
MDYSYDNHEIFKKTQDVVLGKHSFENDYMSKSTWDNGDKKKKPLIEVLIEKNISFIYDAANDDLLNVARRKVMDRLSDAGYTATVHVLITTPKQILENLKQREQTSGRGAPYEMVAKRMNKLYGTDYPSENGDEALIKLSEGINYEWIQRTKRHIDETFRKLTNGKPIQSPKEPMNAKKSQLRALWRQQFLTTKTHVFEVSSERPAESVVSTSNETTDNIQEATRNQYEKYIKLINTYKPFPDDRKEQCQWIKELVFRKCPNLKSFQIVDIKLSDDKLLSLLGSTPTKLTHAVWTKDDKKSGTWFNREIDSYVVQKLIGTDNYFDFVSQPGWEKEYGEMFEQMELFMEPKGVQNLKKTVFEVLSLYVHSLKELRIHQPEILKTPLEWDTDFKDKHNRVLEECTNFLRKKFSKRTTHTWEVIHTAFNENHVKTVNKSHTKKLLGTLGLKFKGITAQQLIDNLRDFLKGETLRLIPIQNHDLSYELFRHV